jgi:hypothetical protein
VADEVWKIEAARDANQTRRSWNRRLHWRRITRGDSRSMCLADSSSKAQAMW